MGELKIKIQKRKLDFERMFPNGVRSDKKSTSSNLEEVTNIKVADYQNRSLANRYSNLEHLELKQRNCKLPKWKFTKYRNIIQRIIQRQNYQRTNRPCK